MPDYVYKCLECDTEIIKTRSIVESEPQYNCEKCGVFLTRQYTPFGVQFNGKGFYSTDNKRV
jgi:putative FmdB family regulatory protein